MKTISFALAGLLLASPAVALAQDVPEPKGPPPEASGPPPADAPADTSADAPAPPQADAAPATEAPVTDAEVESFAAASVKVQAIDGDAAIAADQKQTQMAAAVREAGLEPERFNAIAQKVSSDPELSARIQTAMAKHAQPSEG